MSPPRDNSSAASPVPKITYTLSTLVTGASLGDILGAALKAKKD